MGWTFHYNPPRDPKAEVASYCTWETEVYTAEVVHHVVRGSTHFVAIKKTPKPGQIIPPNDFHQDVDGSYVFAAVFLTRKDRDGSWGYKDMDETMGPCVAPPSKKFITYLSPTSNEYANNWRAKASTPQLRPKIGDTVRLHEPWEPYGDLFTKIEWMHRSRSVYRSVKTGQAVRLRGSQIKEIVK